MTLPTPIARLALASLLLVFVAACGGGGGGGGSSDGRGTPVSASFAWGEASGPVEGYRLVVEREGLVEVDPTVHPEPRATVEGKVGERVRIAVAAVDQNGDEGPISEWSPVIEFTANGPMPVAGAATTAALPGSDAVRRTASASTGASSGAASTDSSAEPSYETASEPIRSEAEPSSEPEPTESTEPTEPAEPLLAEAQPLVWVSASRILAMRLEGGVLLPWVDRAGPGASWQAVGLGDFDADGALDLLWKDAAGVLAYGSLDRGYPDAQLGSLLASESLRAIADLDGDGASDLLVADAEHAETAFWPTAGGAQEITLLEPPEAGAEIVAGGDLDGDGHDDLLWQAPGGRLHLDLMAGGEVVETVLLAVDASGLGSGDFDGDGREDFLLRDADGALSQAGLGDGVAALPLLLAAEVADVADFDGDGRADLLARGADGSLLLRLSPADAPFDLPVDVGDGWQLVTR